MLSSLPVPSTSNRSDLSNHIPELIPASGQTSTIKCLQLSRRSPLSVHQAGIRRSPRKNAAHPSRSIFIPRTQESPDDGSFQRRRLTLGAGKVHVNKRRENHPSFPILRRKSRHQLVDRSSYAERTDLPASEFASTISLWIAQQVLLLRAEAGLWVVVP